MKVPVEHAGRVVDPVAAPEPCRHCGLPLLQVAHRTGDLGGLLAVRSVASSLEKQLTGRVLLVRVAGAAFG